MFGKVADDSFPSIFDLSLDSDDAKSSTSSFGYSSSSSPILGRRRDFDVDSLLDAFSLMTSSPSSDSSASSTISSSSSSSTSTSSKVNASRYKTELCRPFSENGSCKYGDKCQFAHGTQELRTVTRHPKYKTDLCRTYHSVGFCPYGPRCHFIHNLDEHKQALEEHNDNMNNNNMNNNNNNGSRKSSYNNKPIGSGRDMKKRVQMFDDVIKPLPMFDASSTWSPLKEDFRLPVFSTMSK